MLIMILWYLLKCTWVIVIKYPSLSLWEAIPIDTSDLWAETSSCLLHVTNSRWQPNLCQQLSRDGNPKHFTASSHSHTDDRAGDHQKKPQGNRMTPLPLSHGPPQCCDSFDPSVRATELLYTKQSLLFSVRATLQKQTSLFLRQTL